MSTESGGAAEELQTWWKVGKYSKQPEPVRVQRATEHYLVLPAAGTLWSPSPRRVKKDTSWCTYFEEEREAWDWLIERAQRKHAGAQRRARELAQALAELRAAYRHRMESGEVGRG